MKYLRLLVIFMCFSLWMVGQNPSSVLKIRVQPVFGNKAFELNGRYYQLEKKDSVRIKSFKFFLSNISLAAENGKKYLENYSYHLIDAEEAETMEIRIDQIESSNYIYFKCAIGVDSAKNTAGVLNGDLDPAKGMFWAWNTGYIAAKLEGVSPVCKTKDHEFDFHVGGYMPPYQTYRELNFRLPSGQFISGKTTVIELLADVSVWFKDIELEKVNHIVVPGKESVKLADNYVKMLKIKSVSVE